MLKRLYIYRVGFFIFLLSLSSLSHAISITSTKSEYVPGGVNYYFTVNAFLSGGEKLCTDTTASSCVIYIVGARSPGNSAGLQLSRSSWEVPPSTSMHTIYNAMVGKGFSIPYDGWVFVPTGTWLSDTFCISFAYGYRWPSVGGAIGPYGPCAPAIKPALQCDLTGNTTINHREMFSDAIDGNEAETQLQLTCTGAASVKVYTRGDAPQGVKLKANEGLYSKLTIGGKKTSDGMLIGVEGGLPANISLKSTLLTDGVVTPGPFSGSTVLMISPP